MKKTRIIIASVLAAVMSLSGVAENGIATKFVSAAKKPAIAKKISVNVGDTVSIKVKYAGKKTKVKWSVKSNGKKTVVKPGKKISKGKKASIKIKGVAPGKATVKAVINNGKKKITSKCTVTVRSVKNETDVPVAVPTNAPVTQAPVIVTPTNTPESTVGSTNAPTNEPAGEPTNEPTKEPASDPAATPTNEPADEPTKEPDEDIKDEPIVTDQFEITYDRDENIEQIIEYTTQDYESGKGVIVDPKVGFARNKETGDFDVSGEGQVNFKVVPKEGYEVDTVTVVAKDGSDEKYYSSIKGKPDTEVDNLFRVTKITGDIIIKITLKVADNTPVTEFVGTFVVEGGHATITTYKSQNLSEDGKTENATSAVARTKEGEVDINGDGQINFVVNVEDGYKAKVKVSPSINYKNIKDSKEDGLPVNTYRITRIYGDITITVKVSPVE